MGNKIVASDYVHLHNHTQYSLLDGLTKLPDLLDFVSDSGMQAIAMTDHGTLSGAIEFYKLAQAKQIKPIIGIETYVASRKHTDKDPVKDKQRYHLILLAMNNTGYQNLMKLSTIANLDGYYYFPRIDHGLLEQYSEGVIALSACMGGELGDALKNGQYETAKQIATWYQKTFKDRYYLEIQDHGHPDNPLYNEEQGEINKQVLQIGKELNIKVVVTCDAHYLKHEDQDAHEVLLCVGTGSLLSDEKRMSLKEFPLHVTDPKEIIKRWGTEHPEVIMNTKEIADRCNVSIKLGDILIPKFPVPKKETEKTYLHKLVYQGLAWRYGNQSFEKSKELGGLNHVSISYSATKEVCKLSDSYENDGNAMPGRAIRLLEDVIAFCKTHGVRDITEKEVRSFISEKTNVLLDKPTEEESGKLLNLENEIHKRVISQDEAVSAISNAMRRVRSGMKNEGKPIASFLFLGPTGVGKTQTAKVLAKSYFGDEEAMIRLDMSEFQNDEAISTLLGEGFVDKILKNPFSLVLLDEFEKASKGVHDLFLQVLDEGRLTDHLDRVISFKNAIIIATSNAGSEFIREKYKEGVDVENVKKELIEKIQQSGVYKPELINRFDDVIVFKPLSEKDAVAVAKLFLQESIDKIAKQQITLSYNDEVTEFIAKNSFSIEFGARNVRRFIEATIENQLSKLLLSNTLQKGGNAQIVIEDNALVIK